ncbi:DUF1015 domain-containing protein [Carnobacterium funditum]|uniref:DUF1015 domain-containing protein n=1 Tax=Carnobacterium funditum TaxID=2752 RepID=UPI00054EB588|nr:DUF1015 family protein [Carnobacterium funditum]
MVQIRPFKAIRPHDALVKEVVSLPYDVLSSTEAREIGNQNAKSFLHIDKSEIDLAKEQQPYEKVVYQKAADNLKKFIEKQWLIKDLTEHFYVYQLIMNNRVQTGLVVCTSVEDYLNGKIKKHEFTRAEKELDRINHIDTADANTSPIFLTYRDNQSINDIIQNWITNNHPLYDFIGFHEVTHRVWAIKKKKTIEELTNLFSQQVDSLYIADGHHRAESAVKVALKRREQFPDATPEIEFNFFLSVLFPEKQLAIMDYNRVVNVPIVSDYFKKLSEAFEIQKKGTIPFQPKEPKTMGMYLNKEWYELKAKTTVQSKDPVKGLDVSILQDQILTPIFGIEDIRTDDRIDFIGGIRGMQELARKVDSEKFSVAFSMYPTSMEDLLNVADSREVMPPKSTWFEPKLLSGLFVHDLES